MARFETLMARPGMAGRVAEIRAGMAADTVADDVNAWGEIQAPVAANRAAGLPDDEPDRSAPPPPTKATMTAGRGLIAGDRV